MLYFRGFPFFLFLFFCNSVINNPKRKMEQIYTNEHYKQTKPLYDDDDDDDNF